jgi:hypothetical protein
MRFVHDEQPAIRPSSSSTDSRSRIRQGFRRDKQEVNLIGLDLIDDRRSVRGRNTLTGLRAFDALSAVRPGTCG